MTEIYTPMTALPIRLPEDLRAGLARLSAHDHVPQQVHVRLALADYLARKLAEIPAPPTAARRRPRKAATPASAPAPQPSQPAPQVPRQTSKSKPSPAVAPTGPSSLPDPTPHRPTSGARRPRQAAVNFR